MKLGLPRELVCSYNLKRDMSLPDYAAAAVYCTGVQRPGSGNLLCSPDKRLPAGLTGRVTAAPRPLLISRVWLGGLTGSFCCLGNSWDTNQILCFYFSLLENVPSYQREKICRSKEQLWQTIPTLHYCSSSVLFMTELWRQSGSLQGPHAARKRIPVPKKLLSWSF